MKTIVEPKLESDLAYRFQYLAEFVGFGEEEIQAIHGSAPALAPLVPALVDAVYDTLHGFTSAWRHFLPRPQGYEGPIPTKLEELTMDHPQIAFRKQHLGRYLANLVTRPYDGKMHEYLDKVRKIHTPKAGSKEINVPLVQMNALMGFVSDAVVNTIVSLNLPRETEVKTLRAFNKLLWLQNDLITRHYAA